jgi:hypothetical protein
MKEIKYTILYCVCENLYDSILSRSGSGSGTVINYSSGYDLLARYGSGSGTAIQKVTVPVPGPTTVDTGFRRRIHCIVDFYQL